MRQLTTSLIVLSLCACPKPGDDVDPKVRADGHYVAGQSAFLKGDFAEAHKQFAEVKALNPGDPRLPVAEGELYLSEAKVNEAIEAFERAAALDPKRGTTWSRLAYLYSLKKDSVKARAAVDKALAANAKDFNALETLADLQLGEGDVDAGVASLVASSLSAPDASRAELGLRAAQELTKVGRGAEAISVLEALVAAGVTSAPLLTELGDRLVEAQRLAEAADAYERAAQADPKDPTLWELTAEVRLRLGKVDDAVAAFRKSLEVKDRGVVHVALARLCHQKKDSECLKRELDKALETSTGEELRETVELADLLVLVGRKKDGLELLRTLSEEGDQKGNFDLHLRTARLARELKDEVTLKAACTRALASGQAGLKCP
jgi:Flp pilus assembly protein TadD